MLVLTRKAAEGVKLELNGIVFLHFYFVPLRTPNQAALNVVTWNEKTGLNVLLMDAFSLQETVQLPGLPEGIEVSITLVALKTGLIPKARFGIDAPDEVTVIREELEDEEESETEAA